MRTELVVGMLGALAIGGCAASNVVDDAASSLDAGPGTDAFVRDTTPDAFALDAFVATSDARGPDAFVGRRDVGARPDAALDAGPTPPTITYVVAAYDLPDAPRGPRLDEAPGVNLDGRVSVEGGAGSCEDLIGDLVSPLGEPGVDNQLVGSLNSLLEGFIAGYDLQAVLDDDVATGRRLLAIQLSSLDSFDDDPEVRVDLFLVKPEGCAGDVCPPPGGVVSAGARWIRSLVPIGSALPGEIVAGRLHVVAHDFPLSFDASGVTVTMTVRDSILEGDVSAFGLENGVLGGGILVEDLVLLAEMIMPGIGETARGILVDLADLSPSAADPLVCREVSAGMGLTAVPRTLE
jgi:hypothetical protein